MRAVVITSAGGPEVLELQDRPIPEPGLNQVRVRIVASALNRADISQRLGRYPAPSGSPADIPGLEYSGIVDALGEGASLWKTGDLVMGIAGGGTHAEYLCLHEREVMPVPSGIPLEECAAIPEVFLTAYDALFHRLKLQPGETLLIHAAGSGVGTAAIQLAHVSGAITIGTSRSQSKLDRCLELGMTAAFHVVSSDWGSRLLEDLRIESIDTVLDLVGAAYLEGNLTALGSLGRMVSVGLTAGSRAEIDLGLVMRKRLTIVGTVLRARSLEEKMQLAREFTRRMVPLFASGKLRPVVDRIVGFDSVASAHKAMQANENFGKIVLVWR